jgi:hypothetical protein
VEEGKQSEGGEGASRVKVEKGQGKWRWRRGEDKLGG